MMALIVSLFMILPYVNGHERKDTDLYDFKLGSTYITVEVSLAIYIVRPEHIYAYVRDDMKNFNIDDSGIMISFLGTYDRWLAIDCKLLNLDKYIEISGCYVSSKTTPQNPFENFSIGYTFRLNKNTKYVFSTQYIRFKTGENEYPILKIDLFDLLVTFRGYTQKMVIESNENYILCDLTSTIVIDDFSIYGGSYSNESDPSVPLKDDEKPDDNQNDRPVDDHNEILVDVQEDIEHNKKFWTKNKFLVLILSLMAIIITVIIFFIYNRCRQSRSNK
ncbi:hypothetical protein RF11_08413 [Thelohanellus kitauei]|uniref:Uncharacterized protein n=1 Tax=Thelohanellus kitauei TaxID=669202 RepID=A0A0C2MDB8_THEKT|nr:hypothetical protein RF11_08413 [Thelohanellus kitauei]